MASTNWASRRPGTTSAKFLKNGSMAGVRVFLTQKMMVKYVARRCEIEAEYEVLFRTAVAVGSTQQHSSQFSIPSVIGRCLLPRWTWSLPPAVLKLSGQVDWSLPLAVV